MLKTRENPESRSNCFSCIFDQICFGSVSLETIFLKKIKISYADADQNFDSFRKI